MSKWRGTLPAALLLGPACASHYAVPEAPLPAEVGIAPAGFDAAVACHDWRGATENVAEAARASVLSHVAYPELVPEACFVPVDYTAGRAQQPAVPKGCGYPEAAELVTHELRDQARRFRDSDFEPGQVPFALACSLPSRARARVALVNAKTLGALASELERGARFPYAAVATFGYGRAAHDTSRLNHWLPGDRCPGDIDQEQMQLFAINRVRAYRAAQAVAAGVGPVAIFSGGAVHSSLNESFMLAYLASCRYGLPLGRVLLDPCAEHTHENIRNTGGLVVRLAGRTAYLVTDDGLQADYLQEWSLFDWFSGSVDQRSLRDFDFLVGSFRQASRNLAAGFWYTPYRFWADPNQRLRQLTCLR